MMANEKLTLKFEPNAHLIIKQLFVTPFCSKIQSENKSTYGSLEIYQIH